MPFASATVSSKMGLELSISVLDWSDEYDVRTHVHASNVVLILFCTCRMLDILVCFCLQVKAQDPEKARVDQNEPDRAPMRRPRTPRSPNGGT